MRVRCAALFFNLKIERKRASHADARANPLAFVYYHNLQQRLCILAYILRRFAIPSHR